ncbi:MAG: hypothetical protein ABR574_03865 [Cryomorphaceae bacterium]|nr:hypothetical protein [Flavobacteriales bacterium]
MKKHLLILIFIICAAGLHAQTLDESWETEKEFRKTGMLILGGWAAANIAGGVAFRANTSGSTKYFHEMNAIWNTVNLGIAAFGYFSAVNLAHPETALDLYKEQISMDKILLFNAGLDLAYIAGGIFLMERSKTVSKNAQRLRGYGRSMVMQGAFLFVFDLAMVWVHKSVLLGDDVLLTLRSVPSGISATLNF